MARLGQNETATLVGHLDELRTRLIGVSIVFVASLVVAFWRSDEIIQVLVRPLPGGTEPVTLGVSEAFTSTLSVSMYAALLVTTPFALWHVYGFVVPALTERERSAFAPLIFAAPCAFIAGASFAYFVALPPALDFLIGFNADQFDALIRIREYYSFVGTTMLAMGLLFEFPLAAMTASHLGLLNAKFLRQNRRYAVFAVGVVAMLLPGTDPVTMLISMIPLALLFEGSILLVSWVERGRLQREAAQSDELESAADGH